MKLSLRLECLAIARLDYHTNEWNFGGNANSRVEIKFNSTFQPSFKYTVSWVACFTFRSFVVAPSVIFNNLLEILTPIFY